MALTAATAVGERRSILQTIVLVALGVGLGLGLISLKGTLYSVQGGVTTMAQAFPFGYAYAAGMVAAVNPCGILLVPSLVAYYLGSEEAPTMGWSQRAVRALLLGGATTLGFVALFGVVGSVLGSGGMALGRYFPYAGLGIGVIFVLLGLWMIVTNSALGVATAGRAMGIAHPRGDARSMFVFGIGYGVASLACTLPVFLVVVGTAFLAGGLLEAITYFVSYALGMGTMLTAVIVGAAFFRSAVTRGLHRIVPHIHGLAASLLLAAGIFIVAYWLTPSGLVR
jgi:cytochrome c biogenesis protein CcdA